MSYARIGQGLAASILFKPGIPTVRNQYATWAEVINAFKQTNGLVYIGIDDTIGPANVDIGAWDFEGRTTFVATKLKEGPQTILNIPDGATLKNVDGMDDLIQFLATPVVTPSLAFDPGVDVFTMGKGSIIANRGTRSLLDVAAASSVNILMSESSGYDNSLGVNPPFAALFGPGTSFSITSTTGAGLLGSNNTVIGPAGSQLILQYDASWQGDPTLPGYAGVLISRTIDDSEFVQYIPTVLANWSGIAPTSVQNALDRIAAKISPIP